MRATIHNGTRSFFSLLLTIALLVGLLSVPAWAAGTGEVTVSTAQEFIQAVNSKTAWKITLDADIVIEYGMTNVLGQWNSAYQNAEKPGYIGQPQGILVGDKSGAGGNGQFVIDGRGQYKIVFNWPHTIVEQGNFHFPNESKVKSFTMKDVTWYGSSEVGCFFPVGNIMNNLTITFDNVTYKGPGMGDIAILTAYNPQVTFRNCNITMSYRNGSGAGGVDSDGYGGSLPPYGSAAHGALWQDTHASETIAANFVTFEGINTITKQDSPADGGSVLGDIDPIFYIYWAGDSYIKVADGASLIINDEAGKTKQSVYATGLIGTHTSAYHTPFIVGQNATFEYHHVGGGNGFITDYYKLGSLTIGDNANVIFDIKADTKHNTNDVSLYPAYLTVDSISVGKNAKWTYVVDYAGSAAGADNAMVSANAITVADGAEVNLIAKNNTKAETVIALRDSNSGITFANPKNVVLFNSKSSNNSFVIRSAYTARLNLQTHQIRAWQSIPEGTVSMTGIINPGSQGILTGNTLTAPDTAYQWLFNDESFIATIQSSGNLSNSSQGDVFRFSGVQTLKNLNVLELRASDEGTGGCNPGGCDPCTCDHPGGCDSCAEPIPVIDALELRTNYIVSRYDAYINITAKGENLDGHDLTVKIFDKEVPMVDGFVRVFLTKEEVPDVFEVTYFDVVAYIDGKPAATAKMRVKPFVEDRWAVALVPVLDGKMEIRFTEEVAPKTNSEFIVKVNNVSKAVTHSADDARILIIDHVPTAGEVFVIQNVKFPDSYPSFAFTFTVTYEEE